MTDLSPRPPSPRSSRRPARRPSRLTLLLGSAAAVVVAGWLVVGLVGGHDRGPEAAVDAYLGAIEDGDVGAALAQAPASGGATSALLTDGAYAAAGQRLRDHEITGVERVGDVARVRVRLRGIAGDPSTTLTLERARDPTPAREEWAVVRGGLVRTVHVRVPESSSVVEVDGVEIAAVPGASTRMAVLPATYSFDAYPRDRWVDAEPQSVAVGPGSATTFVELPSPGPSKALRTEVDRQLDAWLAECLRTPLATPAGCPQSVPGWLGAEGDVRWTLLRPPVVDLAAFDGTFPARIFTRRPGRVRATYQPDDGPGPADPGRPAVTDSFLIEGTITAGDGRPHAWFGGS